MENHRTIGAKPKGLALWLLVLMAVTALVGCSGGSSVPVSPLQSPLVAVSPVETAVAVETAVSVETPVPESLLGTDFDPAQAVLTAADMGDLFATTYSITQPYQRDGMRGIQVVYPTVAILHTSAFAEGFATQIEVYDEFTDAVKAYYAAVANQAGEPLRMGSRGDESCAFEVPSDTPGVDNSAYVVIIRQANALAIITVKPPDPMRAAALERLADVVVGRLNP